MHGDAPKGNGAIGRESDPEIALRVLEGLSPLVGATCTRKLSVAAARLAAELLDVKACSILLYDPKHRVLRLFAATHIPELEWSSVRVDPAEGLVGSVFKSGKSALLESKQDFARFGIEPSDRYGPPSCIVSPIRIDGRTRGIINISNASSGRIFTQHDLRLIEAAGRIIAAGIQHAEEYQESVLVHDRLEEILESLHVGVVAFDQELRVTHMNQRFRELLPTSTARFKGKALKKVIDPVMYPVCKRLIQDSLARRAVSQDRIAFGIGDRELVLEITASPAQCGESGHCEGLLMIEDAGQDEEVKRLREADSIKGGFLRTVSHELRTPLTVIRGVLPLIKSCGDSVNDNSGKMLGKVEDLLRTNVNRLSGVVNTILDVVEIDSGRLHLTCLPIDLNALVESRIEAVKEEAASKGIRWQRDFDEVLTDVPGDRERLGQALQQLFDNAIKHSPQDGPINVKTFRDGGMAAVWIGNFGDPIAKKRRDEIFEKFYQLDQSTTRERGGVGLGLYLARNVALLHRGSLEVTDGAPGETVFLLKLPLERPPRAEAAEMLLSGVREES